ncbi:putative peptidase [Actinacidiphila reveromycinica]|uniref:Zinc metalloprotease n=1 Tax=Actinacidiphila reveromycinica TaxID=659352 RepID=A0A7U3VQT9_9ACTN|nr:site-2 protease family protein [Streptomyces sp. SN-593]BBB00146.1 putative peptidase [Streptomyces sp. SN-593]
MNGSPPLFRIAGVPLRVHWSAPLLIVVLSLGLAGGVLPDWAPGHSGGTYNGLAVVGALLLLVSLVAHEAAHALVARRADVEVEDVTVFALGGVTRMGTAATARDAGRIAAAGPLTSLLLGGLGLGAAVLAGDVLHWTLVGALLAWTGWANVLLAGFNLVPAAPLDGGRVLQAVVWRLRGDREKAARVAARCGQVAGGLMIAGGWVRFLAGGASGLWLALIGLFVLMAASSELRRSVLFEAVRGLRAADAMRPVATGQDWQTVDRFVAETLPRAAGQPVVPVTDFDGRPSGVVALPALRRVPAAKRGEVRVRAIAAPLESCTLAGPDDQVTDILDHAVTTAGRPILVLADRRVVGMITAEDIVGFTRRRRPPVWPPTARSTGR